MGGGCNMKWCTVMEKNQQYSFMSMFMLLYIDYFVQNVYWACAYIEINFITSMIECNFDVNVFSADFSCLILFFIFLFLWSPDTDNEMSSTAHI